MAQEERETITAENPEDNATGDPVATSLDTTPPFREPATADVVPLNQKKSKYAKNVRKLHKTAEAMGTLQHIVLQGEWSLFTKWLIALPLGIQYALIIAIGFGWLDLQGYEWLLGIVAGQNFIQLISLAAILYLHLFPRIPENR